MSRRKKAGKVLLPEYVGYPPDLRMNLRYACKTGTIKNADGAPMEKCERDQLWLDSIHNTAAHISATIESEDALNQLGFAEKIQFAYALHDEDEDLESQFAELILVGPEEGVEQATYTLETAIAWEGMFEESG